MEIALRYVFIFLLLFSAVPCIRGEILPGGENEDFDFDGLPGLTNDMKFFLDAGRDFCVFFKMYKDNSLYVVFQVVKGGNQNIDVILKTGNIIVQSMIATEQGSFHETATEAGIYEVCFDNSYYHIYSKLVYVYMHVHRPEVWEKYRNEVAELDNKTSVLGESLSEVKKSLEETRKYAAEKSMISHRDYYHIYYSGERVVIFSVLTCIVIMLTSVLQVYVVRRLFRISTLTPTKKPRA